MHSNFKYWIFQYLLWADAFRIIWYFLKSCHCCYILIISRTLQCFLESVNAAPRCCPLGELGVIQGHDVLITKLLTWSRLFLLHFWILYWPKEWNQDMYDYLLKKTSRRLHKTFLLSLSVEQSCYISKLLQKTTNSKRTLYSRHT